MSNLISVVLAVVCLISAVYSYPTGAPSRACGNLAPIHAGTTPQVSLSPYTIDYDITNWSTTGIVMVTITGDIINGFIIQAREGTGDNGVGMFDATKLPEKTQAGPCTLGGKKISVTHTNKDDKNNLTFSWIGPSGYSGDLYFQAAVARNHTIYWTNIKSAKITLHQGPTTTTLKPTTTKPTTPVTKPSTTKNDAKPVSSSTSLLLVTMSAFLYYAYNKY